jgi:ATP-binding cassette subfamily B (MDR/TAP) protein 1
MSPLAVMAGSFSLSQLTPPMQAVGLAKGAAPAIFSLIDRQPSIDAASDEGAKPKSVVGDIEVSGVRFVYPSRCVLFSLLLVFRSSLIPSRYHSTNVPVLHDFSAVFPAGKTTALVGGSGSGKSTIIGLLLRF